MRYLSLFFVLVLASCHAQLNMVDTHKGPPNIVWIVCEDISPTLSMYGDSTSHTPNLDQLASQSIIYHNAYATVGVCAPARSSIITGMYPTSIGTMHMRTGKDITAHGKRTYSDRIEISDINGQPIREYAVVTPSGVKTFTEHLRAAGYYCTNNQKTDYQFASPLTAWDENNDAAHWRNCPKETPFFSVFNYNVTHESMLWKNSEKALTVDPAQVPVPPYFPDTPEIRQMIARHYSNVELLDQQIGKIIDQLKADRLYDETIIFFYSDHGGPLPRQKREAYDSGLKVPLMVKLPNQAISQKDKQMISFVDLAPTVLSLAEVDIPEYIEGEPFLGPQQIHSRKYIYGSADRFDEYTDRVRIIRSDSFLYVRNYYPEKPGYKDLSYRKNIPDMQSFLDLAKEGKLNPIQNQWFQSKTTEELYSTYADPHNINNLASLEDYQAILIHHRKILDHHMSAHTDLGAIGESQLISSMWPNGYQPTAGQPTVSIEQQKVIATVEDQDASIAYYISDHPITQLNRNDHWQLYTGPIEMKKGKYYYFLAERIGFKTSAMVSLKI